jgi:hypothetical protein
MVSSSASPPCGPIRHSFTPRARGVRDARGPRGDARRLASARRCRALASHSPQPLRRARSGTSSATTGALRPDAWRPMAARLHAKTERAPRRRRGLARAGGGAALARLRLAQTSAGESPLEMEAMELIRRAAAEFKTAARARAPSAGPEAVADRRDASLRRLQPGPCCVSRGHETIRVSRRAVRAHDRQARTAQVSARQVRLLRGQGLWRHYRPKGGFRQRRSGVLKVPGYYWLAYDWRNLLVSCAVCNRREEGPSRIDPCPPGVGTNDHVFRAAVARGGRARGAMTRPAWKSTT